MLQHIPRVLSPDSKQRFWIRRGLGFGAPSAGIRRCLGVPPLPLPLPAPRLDPPLVPLLTGPGAGSWKRLAAAALLVLRVRRGVPKEEGSGQPTYQPWMSLSLRYLKDTRIRPPGSVSDTVANTFTQAFR